MTKTQPSPTPRKSRFQRRGSHATAEPRRTLRRLNASIAWLALLGTAAIVVGGHDSVAGTEITVRIFGCLILGAGVVLVAGAVGLSRQTQRGRGVATVAALLGVALGVLTFLAQLVNDEPDRRLVLWGAIAVVSLGVAWIVHSVTPDEERTQGLWNQVPILKTVVSAGLLLSLGQFWYTSIYVPTTAPASVTIETRIEHKREGSRSILQGTVTVRNTSGTRVSVVGSILDVSAGKVADGGDIGNAQFAEQVREAQQRGLGAASLMDSGMGRRYASLDLPTVVARGPLLLDGSYFDPNETVTVPFIAWVPSDGFDVATATVGLVVARARALALEDATTVSSGDAEPVAVKEIPEAGWFRRLTRNDRFIQIAEDDGAEQPPVPRVTFSTHRDRPSSESFDRRMWRLYGVNITSSSAVVTIPESPAPSAKRGTE